MLTGTLTEAQAGAIAAMGPEAVTLALMAASVKFAAEVRAGVSTPPGMVPVYEKPGVDKGRRRKRPGAKAGHPGSRRQVPVQVDERQEHRLEVCWCCGGELQRCDRTRTRIIEEIPADITPVVTEHTIHRDYCPNCKKHVEPAVPDAMPNATPGHHAVALSGFFHYGLGLSIEQSRDLLGGHLQMQITAGGLMSAWGRMAEAISPWYDAIHDQLLDTACLHADETGWRVDGATYWLWCFCDRSTCYYQIDKSRGSAALQRFFTRALEGTLVSDFWATCDGVVCDDRQVCLVHLLRELEKVGLTNTSQEWVAFSKQLKRLVEDGLRLRKRPDFTPDQYRSRITLIHRRLVALSEADYTDPDTKRLADRLQRFRDFYFTFLDKPSVPPDNNPAERQIRPAVIMRKNILCNRSDQGAQTQAILMTVFRTLKLRGHTTRPGPSPRRCERC